MSNNHLYNSSFAVGQKGAKGERGQSCNNTKEIEKIEDTLLEIQKNESKLRG